MPLESIGLTRVQGDYHPGRRPETGLSGTGWTGTQSEPTSGDVNERWRFQKLEKVVVKVLVKIYYMLPTVNELRVREIIRLKMS